MVSRVALLAIAAVAIALAAVGPPPPAHAQSPRVGEQPLGVDDSLPPLADLSIVADYPYRPALRLTVRNNTVGRHPAATAALVKVRVVFGAVNGYQETSVWEIRNLPPGDSATTEYKVPYRGGPHWPTRAGPDAPTRFPMRLYAEIIETDPAEPTGFQHNNAAEGWLTAIRIVAAATDVYEGKFTNGDASVSVRDISDRLPEEGGATTFTVSARNSSKDPPGDAYCDDNDYYCNHRLFDVQVKISLSPGLALAGNQQAPDGTTFDPATGIWDIGTLIDLQGGSRVILSLPVAVNLTGSLEDLPLEERCLTAEVVRAVPNFALDRSKRENDTVTVCLGDAPKLLLTGGDFTLIDFYPCIGVTSYPCTTADTLELVATAFSRRGLVTWGLSESERESYVSSLLQPESFIVHVPDPDGRTMKAGSVIWSTKNVMDLEDSQTRLTSSWEAKESVKVTAPGGGDAPGRWLLTNTNDSAAHNFDLLDATDSSTVTYDFYSLTEYGYNPRDYYIDVKVDFWALGTYKALFGIAGRLSGVTYTDTGTYTFHVGPVSDLEVHDAGPNPEVAAGQRAYTVMAVNNGPDFPPLVKVTLTGVPRGAEVIASEGHYDHASSVWTIGKLTTGDRRANGYAAEGPTLTLVTDDLAAPDITATIENTRDYCVRIKTGAVNPANDLECDGSAVPDGYTEHTANYYDHIEENGKDVEIAAHAGTGSYSGTPVGVKLMETPVGNILQWGPVGRVNGHPVTHYEVQRLDLASLLWKHAAEVRDPIYLDEDAKAGYPAYRVRAVNWVGFGGPWSRPAPDVGLDQPGAAPAVDSVRITSTPGAGDAYQLGETIAVEVVFSEAVRVRGTPTLALGIGDGARQASMASHSGKTLTFSYIVAAGDSDSDGMSVPENGLTLPEGAGITNARGKVAVLGFSALDDQAGHKVNAPGDEPEPEPPYYVEAPEAPAALTAEPGDGQVTLRWAEYCCDRKDIFYQVWRGDFAAWENIEGSGRDTVEHTVSGLTNGDTYRFRVRAVYRHVEDDGSVTEHPGAPSGTAAATPYAPPSQNTPANNPPVFAPDDKSYSVVERAPRGTEVARVRATDSDGDRLTYTLSGEHADRFSIANVGGEGVIRVAEMELGLTWEPGGVSFTLGVEVSDTRGGRDSRFVGVEVTASGDRQAVLRDADPGTLSVACGAAAGTTVATINAASAAGDSLWYILVDGADEFQFAGGGMGPAGTIWSDDHAVKVSDGSGAALEVAETLSGAVCGTTIWVVVEIEEDGNAGNNDTVSFEVRVGAPPPS